MVKNMLEIAMNQINVPDLDKAIKWYTEKLGFEVSKEHYYPLKKLANTEFAESFEIMDIDEEKPLKFEGEQRDILVELIKNWTPYLLNYCDRSRIKE